MVLLRALLIDIQITLLAVRIKLEKWRLLTRNAARRALYVVLARWLRPRS